MTLARRRRPLLAVPAGSRQSILDLLPDLLPDLRAALSGAGPALLLPGTDPLTDTTRTPTELTERDDDPQDPTVLAVTTSGSTGASKTVLLPASALLASVGATHDRLGGAGHWLLALPVQHIAGAQVLLRSLVAGTRPVVMDLNSGFTPEGFVEAASQMGGGGTARRYTSLVPTQLIRLLNAPGRPGELALEALRRFDAVLVGGAATSPVLREQAAAAGVRVVGTYGMTETCGGCVYDGSPLDGVKIRIEDGAGRTNDGASGTEDGASRTGDGTGPIKDGAGRIVIGGPVVARGYLNADGFDGSGRSEVPSIFSTDAAGDRWFRTDDAGYLLDPGGPGGDLLRITGRLDSIIITGGVNVAPGPVEAALVRLPGVAEAIVVGLPDPDWGQRVAAAVVLVPGSPAPSLEQARALVAEQVSGPAAPRQLTVLAALPLRGPGKPDRAAIAKMLAES